MHAALRPYVTSGVALVGASLIAVTPMTPPSPDIPIEHLATRLLASSIANVPYNVVADIANIPYYESLALEEYAYALGPAGSTGGVPGWIPPGATVANGGATPGGLYTQGGTGSWYMESIGNTWGWDNGNWPQLAAISGFLLPFQFTEPIAAQVQSLAQSEIIDGAAVNCEFECANPLGYFGGWFQTPLTALLSPGYTFPNTLADTIGANSSTGVVNVGPNSPNVIWGGQPGTLNPLVPFTAIANNLTGSPANNPIMLPNLATLIPSVIQLGNELNYLDFNPFVQGSFLYWGAPTLYSIPAAIGGTIQDFTGIPNPFINLPGWQPNGAEPLSGYTAGLPQLVSGLPQGFQYLLTGLLDYVSPTLAAGLSGPLNALGSLGTQPAALLQSTGIANLFTALTTTAPSALANLNTQVGQALVGTLFTGSSATGLSSLLSGTNAGTLSALGSSLLGTGSGSSATGLSSLLSGMDAASVLGLGNSLLGTTSNGSSAPSTTSLLSGMNPASVLALGNSLLGTGSGSSTPSIPSLLSGLGGGSPSTLVNSLSGPSSSAPSGTNNATINSADLPSTPTNVHSDTVASEVVQQTDTPKTQVDQPHWTLPTPPKVTASALTDGTNAPDNGTNAPDNGTGGKSNNVMSGTFNNVTSGGNKAVPGGKFGGTSTTSGGNSFSDRINSAVSKALGGLGGGGNGSGGNGGGPKVPGSHHN